MCINEIESSCDLSTEDMFQQHIITEMKWHTTYQNRTCGVHNISSKWWSRVTTVNSLKQELPLNSVTPLNILLVFTDLNSRIFWNDSSSWTWCIQQDSIKSFHYLQTLQFIKTCWFSLKFLFYTNIDCNHYETEIQVSSIISLSSSK